MVGVLETSYMYICIVNPLTCLIGTHRENTSFTKETNGKAITTELTAESGTCISMQTLMTICLCLVKGLPHGVLMVGVF